jgi:glycosyltransferase involved in cell wall biosynthesis
MANIRLSLIIPTYNEQDTVEKSLTEIAQALGPELSHQTEIILVDDGTDGLNNLAPQLGRTLPFFSVEYMRNLKPLGKGASVAQGVEDARGELVGYMDVDLSTPPRYIHNALKSLEGGVCEVFIGSRRAPGSKVERQQFFVKDILGYLLYAIVQRFVFAGMRHYKDTQCGFKFFKNRAAKILYKDILAPDGLTDLEILIRANLLGMHVEECGIEWTDVRESKRALKRILLGELFSMVKILFNYTFLPGKQKRKLEERRSLER